LTVDTSGHVFVTGQTHSADYPITAATALQPSFTLAGSCQGSGSVPHSAAFVSKLSSDGTKLLYSTFVGGTSVGSGNLCDQYATTIALDGSGNIWTIGATGADSFPTTANAYSQTHFGAADIYVHEISADGSTLLYGTYFGGSGNDFPTFGMAMDSSGDIYFGGVSASGADYPLKDSVQAFGGSNDAVVTEILPGAGSTSLVFSTFLGRSSDDVGQGLALDSQGNIHLSGATDSTNFPVVNALQTQFADSIASPDHNDAFIAEFGSGLIGQVTLSTGGNFGSTTSKRSSSGRVSCFARRRKRACGARSSVGVNSRR
jgi:hypothetical protein